MLGGNTLGSASLGGVSGGTSINRTADNFAIIGEINTSIMDGEIDIIYPGSAGEIDVFPVITAGE